MSLGGPCHLRKADMHDSPKFPKHLFSSPGKVGKAKAVESNGGIPFELSSGDPSQVGRCKELRPPRFPVRASGVKSPGSDFAKRPIGASRQFQVSDLPDKGPFGSVMVGDLLRYGERIGRDIGGRLIRGVGESVSLPCSSFKRLNDPVAAAEETSPVETVTASITKDL